MHTVSCSARSVIFLSTRTLGSSDIDIDCLGKSSIDRRGDMGEALPSGDADISILKIMKITVDKEDKL